MNKELIRLVENDDVFGFIRIYNTSLLNEDLTERHKCRSPLSLSQVTKLFKMLYVTIGDNNKSKDLLIIKCVKHKLYKFINFLTK